jgi:hypothetical protein
MNALERKKTHIEQLLLFEYSSNVSSSIRNTMNNPANLKKIKLDDVEAATVLTGLHFKGYSPLEISFVLNKPKGEIESLITKLELAPVTQTNNAQEQFGRQIARQIQDIPKDNFTVMMGTTPSGPIHIANLYTFITSLSFIKNASESYGKSPSIQIGVNDFTVKESEFCNVAARKPIIEKVVQQLSDYFGLPIAVEYFSDFQRTEKFRKAIQYGIDNSYIRSYFNLSEIADNRIVEVPHSQFKLNEKADYCLGTLQQTIAFRAHVNKPDLHVLGGDQGHVGKLYRPASFLPDYKTPRAVKLGRVFGLDGQEMHVSSGNYLPYTDFVDKPDWIDSIQRLGYGPFNEISAFEYWDLLSDKHKPKI